MNKFKFLSVIILSIIFSCTTEDTSDEQLDSFNVKETYEFIVYNSSGNLNRNSSSSNGVNMDEYNSLTNVQKAALWNYKYSLFENSNTLSQSQIQVLNDVKEFSINSITNDDYNEEVVSTLDLKIQEQFTIDQYFDLMYYLDNPSVSDLDSNTSARSGCFWCNETISEGPCRLTYYNGNAVVVKTITFRRRRLFIGFSTGFADVPCSDSEIFDQWDTIFN